MELDGRAAIVTGGSRGIGLAIVEQLAEAGCKVVLCGRNETAAQEAACTLRDAGRDVIAVGADVSDQDSVKNLVAVARENYGRIDILVNNAGIVADGLLLRMSEENWRTVLDTNLSGVFNCTKAVTRVMVKQRYGRIITVGSVVGVMGNAGQANYCAAKAGVIGFTKAVARELGARGITANVVAPGFVETSMTDDLDETQRQRITDQIVLGRLGTPTDVAACVRFLASDAAGYITGQVIQVDGGLRM